MMRVIGTVLVVGLVCVALALVWVNHSQVETIARLQEQNGLLRTQARQERVVCRRLEGLNRVYARSMSRVTTWLGLGAHKGLGGPVCGQEGPQ